MKKNPGTRRPRKRARYGQHFLVDALVVQKIIAFFNPKPGQEVLEIGAGKGALTLPLLEHLYHCHAIELDRSLTPSLVKRCHDTGSLTLHTVDALDFFLPSLPKKKWRLIGNLPYNVGTPILFHYLRQREHITDMLFMLQKEVADRLCAIPGEKNYGRLTISCQYFCSVEMIFVVDPESFSPPPRVNSAVVRLVPRTQPLYEVGDLDFFFQLTRTAFSQRRKQIGNALSLYANHKDLAAVDIEATLRAEDISIEKFARLSRYLKQHDNKNEKQDLNT